MNHPILSKSALSCARVLCLILTIQTTLSAQQWDSLAGFVAPPNEVWSPHLVFNNGQAHIAFRGGYDSTETALISDQSNLWDTLGSASLTNGPESDQFLAFDNNGMPYIAYVSADNGHQVAVIRYQNNAWEPVGNLSTESIAYQPSLIFNQNNELYLSYSYTDNSIPFLIKPKSKLCTYSTNQWSNCGATLEGQFVSLALTVDNDLYLAYNHNTGLSSTDGLTVQYFNVGLNAFQSVGTAPIAAAGMATSIVLCADSSDLYLAFVDSLQNNKLSVMQYDGTSWNYLGNAGLTASAVNSLSFEVIEGTPFVAFDDADYNFSASVMHYDSNTWAYYGAAGFSTSAVEAVSLAQKDGEVYVAFKKSNDGRLSMMKYRVSVSTESIASLSRLITVYPNPAQASIAVETTLTLQEMKLLDLEGRLLKVVYNRFMSLDDIQAGVYILEIQTDKGSLNRKIIKQ